MSLKNSFLTLSIWLCIHAKATFLGRCLVGLQYTLSSESLKKPLQFTNTLDLYFSTNPMKSPQSYELPSELNRKEGLFRGMSLTREELENIRKKGLDPNLSMRGQIYFGGLSDAVFYARSRHENLVKDGKERILVVLQLTPDWSKKINIDEHQPAYYTRNWIPPQAIQSILAAEPKSKEALVLKELILKEP